MTNPEQAEGWGTSRSRCAPPPRKPGQGAVRAAWRGVVWAFRTIWMAYQIALGFVLVVLFYLFAQAWGYFHVGDIRALRHEPPETTAFIEAARAAHPDRGIRRTWVPLDSIPRALKQLVLVAEDAKFYTHQGFDLEQIEYALVSNHQAGRAMRGASTITQQTAKNLYLGGEKELNRKIREAVLALLLEQTLTKDRIFEVYLNIAQFGPGVFGVREGARHHFDRDVRDLTPEQMLALAALLPSPTRWNPAHPTAAYLSHKHRVARNFGLVQSLAGAGEGAGEESGDSLGTGEDAQTLKALDSVSTLMADEAWRKLRTGPVERHREAEGSATDTADVAGAAAGEENLPAEGHDPAAGMGENALAD